MIYKEVFSNILGIKELPFLTTECSTQLVPRLVTKRQFYEHYEMGQTLYNILPILYNVSSFCL